MTPTRSKVAPTPHPRANMKVQAFLPQKADEKPYALQNPEDLPIEQCERAEFVPGVGIGL